MMVNEPRKFWDRFFVSVKGLINSYRMTFLHLLRQPITEEYPEYKRPMPERSRGRIILTVGPDGNERCVACYLCSAVCPVSCISMAAAERQDGRRYASWFRINFARCIYCGLCEEACPTLAIQLTPDYEFGTHTLLDLVYEKDDLLVNHGGRDSQYDFYCHAGIGSREEKGSHINEKPPVDVRSIMP